MTIDVTSNSQYVSLQKSYEQRIDTDQKIIDGVDKLNTLRGNMSALDPHSQKYADMNKQCNSILDNLKKLDPDGSIRTKLDNNSESITQLKDQEVEALKTLGTVLIGQDAIQQAHDAAAQATGAASKSEGDIMTRVMLTFAMLGQADEKVVAGQMDSISGNVDKITQLNSLSEAVRSARPGGTDGNATKQLSADVVNQLKSLGVQLPDVKPDSGGQTYTFKQSDFDTTINNVQSTESSLTTLNQNKTIDLNKAIDVSQQCTTFESTDLDKWSQLMQKLSS
jgi:hypothetical protein